MMRGVSQRQAGRAVSSLLLVGVLCLAACSPVRPARWIRIDPPPDRPVTGRLFPAPGNTLQVRSFSARGILQEPNLAYLDPAAPTDVRQAASIVWEETPASAVQTYLGDALRRHGVDVVAAGSPTLPAYTLSGTVQRFELVGDGRTGIATVALDLAVTLTETGASYFRGSYCVSVPATDPRLRSVETAFDIALKRLVGEFAGDLAIRAKGGKVERSNASDSRLHRC